MVHLLATFPGHYGTPVMRIKEEMTENREANNDPPILLLPPTRTRRARPPDCTTCYHRKWGRTGGGSNLKTTLIGAQYYPPSSLERAVEQRSRRRCCSRGYRWGSAWKASTRGILTPLLVHRGIGTVDASAIITAAVNAAIHRIPTATDVYTSGTTPSAATTIVTLYLFSHLPVYFPDIFFPTSIYGNYGYLPKYNSFYTNN